MSFKEWLMGEARLKGLKRQFVQSNPNMPKYVANDLYNNRVAYAMNRQLGSPAMSPTGPHQPLDPNAPTAAWADPELQQMRVPNQQTPSQIMRTAQADGVQWQPKPVTINVGPLDFDDRTIDTMLYRRFGFEVEPGIRQDAQRTATQNSMMKTKKMGANEPIIVVWENGKYKLLEGWHRTMNYLVFDHNEKIGAPPDQIEALRSGDMNSIDLNRWQRVPILAYVGVRQNKPVARAA